MQEPSICATNSAGDLGDGEIVELGMTMSSLNGFESSGVRTLTSGMRAKIEAGSC